MIRPKQGLGSLGPQPRRPKARFGRKGQRKRPWDQRIVRAGRGGLGAADAGTPDAASPRASASA